MSISRAKALNTWTVGGFKTFAVFRMQSLFFWEFLRRLKLKADVSELNVGSIVLIAQDDGTDIEFRNVGF